jgi:hypothetical protein
MTFLSDPPRHPVRPWAARRYSGVEVYFITRSPTRATGWGDRLTESGGEGVKTGVFGRFGGGFAGRSP